jgi:hypothetical protein
VPGIGSSTGEAASSQASATGVAAESRFQAGVRAGELGLTR